MLYIECNLYKMINKESNREQKMNSFLVMLLGYTYLGLVRLQGIKSHRGFNTGLD
jgi:hypothetical protein